MEGTLVVGEYGKLSTKPPFDENKIWQIAVWSVLHAIKF